MPAFIADAVGPAGEIGELDDPEDNFQTQQPEGPAPGRGAQIVMFCGFATDRQLTVETAHIGGSRVATFRRPLTFRNETGIRRFLSWICRIRSSG